MITWRPRATACDGCTELHGSAIVSAAGVPPNSECLRLSHNPQLRFLDGLDITALKYLDVSSPHPDLCLQPLLDARQLRHLNCSGCAERELQLMLRAKADGRLPALTTIEWYGAQEPVHHFPVKLRLHTGWKTDPMGYPGLSVNHSRRVPGEFGYFIHVEEGTHLRPGSLITNYVITAALAFDSVRAREEIEHALSDSLYVFPVDLDSACSMLLIGDPFCAASKINSCCDPNTQRQCNCNSANVEFLSTDSAQVYPGCPQIPQQRVEVRLLCDLPPGRHELIARYTHVS
jgi:hypothetical protein